MSKNLKISLALVAAFVAAVAIAVVFTTSSESRPGDGPAVDGSAASAESGGPAVVRANSNVLSEAPDGKVTLVEFLDFECEACLAAYPFVEQLREEYEGEVTFIARYFPIPSHANAENAALSVQAAANQGEFEAMYDRMYETQREWGEQQESRADLFRGFAEEMGLDMEQYDADVADPATLDRVELDRDDGIALGVEGTPTFFLNGEIIQPGSPDEFRAMIDDALAE